MNAGVMRRCLAAMLIALLSGSRALAEQAMPSYLQSLALTEANSPVASVEDWDRLVDSLTRASWLLHDAGDPNAIVAGRPVGDYYDLYVLLPESKTKLDTLRDEARQRREAGDDAGVTAALAKAQPLLRAEKYKAGAVLAFVGYAGLFHYHRKLLAPWLARAVPAEQTSADAVIASANAALVKALDGAIQAAEYDLNLSRKLSELTLAPVKTLDAQRLRLVAEQARFPNPVPIAPMVRTSACPPAVPPSPDRQKPGLGSNFPASEDFYPAEPKGEKVTGPVTVHVLISDTGCPVRAEIGRSSGDPTLDKGALDLAMAGHYVPGSKGGQAVPGELRFRVKFELED